MNHAIARPAVPAAHTLESPEEAARLRRLRSLIALLAMYATALLAVITLSDGADIGCILAGIAGHVLYATGRIAVSWRDDAWIEHAREASRVRRRAMRLRLATA